MKNKSAIIMLLFVLVIFANSQNVNSYRAQLDYLAEVARYDFQPEPGVHVKSKTPYILEALNALEDAPEEVKKQAKMILSPDETLEEIYDTPEGHFRIHYETTGSGGVDMEFVETLGEYFEYAYDLIIDSLGYLPPPSDGGYGGADNIDVYVRYLYYYGSTTPIEAGDYDWDDRSSYIEINNNFDGFPANDDPEGAPWGHLKVTSAHELYHVVQLGYRGSIANPWILEIGATWMEDAAWNHVNDYIAYVDNFYEEPHVSITNASGMHMYGSCVFFHFIEDKLGINAIRKIWENARYIDDYTICLDSAFAEYESSLEYEFAEFSYWNWFTYDRDIGIYFEDADRWDPVYVENTITSYPAFENLSRRPNFLGSSYIVLENINPEQPGMLVNIYGSTSTTWKLRTIVENADETYMLNRMQIPSSGEAGVYIDELENVERIIVIPSAVEGSASASWETFALSFDANYADIDTIYTELERIEKIDENQILPDIITTIAYPNPFNSSCTIELENHQEKSPSKIRIMDLSGRRIEEFALQNGQNKITWNPKGLPSGMYLYSIENQDGNSMKMGKIILQK
ncbi:MAG: MXAN_6640 family putative metalloprotease [Candidatus Zixiibacteriota bacterium]